MTVPRPLDSNLVRWLAEPQKSGWVDGARSTETGPRLEVVDPATESVIATVPDSTAGAVGIAVDSATRAFRDQVWRGLTPAEREARLLRLADLLEAHAVELQHLIVLENGKLIQGAEREVSGTIRFTRYMAGWATKLTGQTLDLSLRTPGTGYVAYTRREPVGVVAGIIPWNMPLSMAAWKAIPALACGCTVILKPAVEAPLSTLRLAELASEAGLPPGVLNVVTGGDRTGAALVAHPGVAKVTFTGSTEVGRQVGVAAMGRLARVSLELGGKSPAIVLADADPARVAAAVAQGIFYNGGQVCAAGSRLFVARPLFESIVGRVTAIAAGMRIGAGLDPSSEIGPLVSDGHRDRVLGSVARATADGAQLRSPANEPGGPGYFVRPAVFTDTTPAMSIERDEVFGPVLVAIPFDTEADLVARVNQSRYGLAASIYSEDLSAVHRLIPLIEAGTIFVNSPARTDPALPMGGLKESGIGREHGAAMIDLYTESKSVVIGYQT